MSAAEEPIPIILAHEAPFALGGMHVRPSSREVLAGERHETVEPRVMQVLVALARRRGEVISRDDLTQSCWGGRVVSDDAINRAISGMRRLAKSYGGFSIETVARVGYRLDEATAAPEAIAVAQATPRLAVLPFENLSADPDLAYFSDGVSEEILNTVARARDLTVISRRSSFQFRGAEKAMGQVVAELNATHLLDGSVRRSGDRVRIAVQLVECASDTTLWSERFDRDLSDVFALQDEISEAVIGALKATLLPDEKGGVTRRGTESVSAYDLYLMARQEYVNGVQGDPHWAATIARLSRRATEIDPNYARAWAMLALGQVASRYFAVDGDGESGLAAAERALQLDPDLALAHVVKARVSSDAGQHTEANDEIAIALQLNPGSWSANYTAGLVFHAQRRFEEAIRYFERAAALDETDITSPTFLIGCFLRTGERAAALPAAEVALAHAEKALSHNRNNSYAMAMAAEALAVLGQGQRAREWIERALLVDPENFVVRHSIAGTLAGLLEEPEAAVEMIVPALPKMSANFLNLIRMNHNLGSIREHPRLKAMMTGAQGRDKDRGPVNSLAQGPNSPSGGTPP